MNEQENNKKEISNDDIFNFLIQCTKKVGFCLLIYLVGYTRFSFSWILGLVIFLFIRDQIKRKTDRRRDIFRDISKYGEKEVILAHIGDLPAWVFFPDIERAEWLNKIMKQLWTRVNHYGKDIMTDIIEPSLRKNMEAYKLKGFKFERIVLGSVPFRIGGVVVHDNVGRDEIVMDLDISYAGDCDITFHLTGMRGGIRNFQLYGRVRVVMKPLISTIPLAGGLQVYFLNDPAIDFDLVGVAQVLEIPGLKELLKKIVVQTISSMMVLPNKFPIVLSNEVDSAILKTDIPEGVLRVHVIEAKNLINKDINLLGKGKSDPYAVLRVGAQQLKTTVIDNNLNPKWDEWFEFTISDSNAQTLKIQLWDDDANIDESLGKAVVQISNIVKAGQSDLWLTLEGVKHGTVHLRLTWLDLSTNYGDLQAALVETQQLRLTKTSTALLTVFIDSASDLPCVRSSSNPDPYAVLQVGKSKQETKPQQRTRNPVWEEGFTFFVSNPDADSLSLRILDLKTEHLLSELTYNISNLSGKNNLEIIKQPFKLSNSSKESTIIWSLHLRVFKNCSDVVFEDLRVSRSSVSSQEKRSLVKRDSTNSDTSVGSEVFDKRRPSTGSTTSVVRPPSTIIQSTGDNSNGVIHLTLRYSSIRQRLIVVVHKVLNLPYKDPNDLPDVYVKTYLLPDKYRESKQKTPIIKKNANPVYEVALEYLVSQGDLNSKTLEVSVIHDKIMKNPIFGTVMIELEKYDLKNPYSAWFSLIPEK